MKSSTVDQQGKSEYFSFAKDFEFVFDELHIPFKVLLSCSDTFNQFQLPQLPQNISLEQNFDETDCTITSISWNPSPNHRPDNW